MGSLVHPSCDLYSRLGYRGHKYYISVCLDSRAINVPSVKCRVDQNTALHATTATGMSVFLIFTFLVPSVSFSSVLFRHEVSSGVGSKIVLLLVI